MSSQIFTVILIISAALYYFLMYLVSLKSFNVLYFGQKKFYKHNYNKVCGKVIAYKEPAEYKDNSIWKNEIPFMIDVQTSEGETYHITTTNKKARKYRGKTDIIVLVPVKKKENEVIFNDEGNEALLMEDNTLKFEFIISLILYLVFLFCFF